MQLILPSAYSKFSLSGHTHSNTHTHTQGPPLVGWQHAASELPSNTATATENDLNTEKCVQFFALGYFGRYKEVQGGIPFDETCKQSLGGGGAKVEGTICKQLLSSLKAKFSSFIYFRFLIIISSIFSVAALHFVSCLCMSLCLQHFRVPAPSAHFNEFVVNMCAIYLQAPLATWRARPPPCSSQSAHCPRFCTLFFLRLARLFCC